MYDPGLRHTAEGELAAVGGRRGNVVWYLAVHGTHGVGRLEAVGRRRGGRRLRRAATARAVRLAQYATDTAQTS